MEPITELRLKIKELGYSPIPCDGKRPPMSGWDKKVHVTTEEVALWPKSYHLATNTGIFTRITPTIDIDILNSAAADAVEALARDRFEERGNIIVRFGEAPKRAIPLRTDQFFKKITANLVSPQGKEEKIELLADGQQVVVFGIHPGTGKPYSWHGGDPSNTPWDDLPYANEADARSFITDAAKLLVDQYGYTAPDPRPKDTVNGTGGHQQPADWAWLVQNILAGRDIHTSTLSLSAKLARAGMSKPAIVNMVRGLLQQSSAPHDKRWQDRYDDIPRIVSTAQEPPESEEPAPAPRIVLSSAEFVRGFIPPDYLLDGILQRRFCYSLTGRTGSGKTAIALMLAALVAMGAPLGKREIAQGRVLYFAGENPDDVRMRWIALAPHLGFDVESIKVDFVPSVVEISAISDKICQEVAERGNVSFVIVDTSVAFFEGDDENSNAQQLTHAKRLRGLASALPGGPAILTLCHPTKNALSDNLIPRGGGSFLAEMDGNLTCSREETAVELHWQGKFRGPDFPAIAFRLETVTHERLIDSKNRPIPSVIASYLSQEAQEEIQEVARSKEDLLLAKIHEFETEGKTKEMSHAKLARELGWFFKNGEPYKSAVQKTAAKLMHSKLVTEDRGAYSLTDKGRKALAEMSPQKSDTEEVD